MAQNLSSIFSGTLGATQLESDNEHTLVTTNSSTTHIIKDVYVNNSQNVNLGKGAGTYLELNGHKVADVTNGGLTGELIVPPNSTLKLKNHSYPYSFEYRRTWFQADSSDYLYLKRTVNDVDTGAELGTLSEMRTNSNNLQRWNETIDVQSRYTTTTVGSGVANHIWRVTHDNNSVQTIRAVGIQGENTSSDDQKTYQNYRAIGFTPDRLISAGSEYDNLVIQPYNGYFQEASITGGGGSTVATTPSFSNLSALTNRTAAGRVLQSPTSSYPRGLVVLTDTDAVGGYWSFWIPSSGYSTDIYAYTRDIRQNFRFTMPRGWGGGSGNYNFGVSIDVDNDKLIFWRWASTTGIHRHACTTPWSTITSSTQSVSTQDPIHFQSGDFSDENNLPLSQQLAHQSMAETVISNRIDGGFAHKGTDGCLHHYNGEGTFLYKDASFTTNDGAKTSGHNSAPWAFRAQLAPDFLLSSMGISSPTFDLSLHGYTIS